MSVSYQDLEKIAQLAYLEKDTDLVPQLMQEINEIIDFVDKLRSVDTKDVAPLLHPLARSQPLRADCITEEDCLTELAEIAPLFADNVYLVPQVLDKVK